MSAARMSILGLLAVAVLGVFGYNWFHQKNVERVRDYANVMSDTHARAIGYYREVRAKNDSLNNAFAGGQGVDPEQLAEAREAHLLVAEKTREEMKTLARVVPPEAARSLQRDGLDFLETRAKLAETVASLLDLVEKRARGQEVSESSVMALAMQMQQQAKAADAMAEALREKKDALVL